MKLMLNGMECISGHKVIDIGEIYKELLTHFCVC